MVKKKLDWNDYLFISVVVFFLLINIVLIFPLKQLPSPIYGGDYYYHFGYINHLLRGGSIFTNSQYVGEAPWAPFLYQGIISIISFITTINPIYVNIYTGIVFLVLSMFILYYFCNKFFNSKLAGILGMICYAGMFPIFKYSPFVDTIIMPLFFFLVWIAIEKKKWIYYILAGLSYGLIGISHTLAFIAATIFLIVLLIYLFIIQHKRKLLELKDYFIKNSMFFIVLVIIGVLIAMLYWYQPVFKFNFKTSNNIAEYDSNDIMSGGLIKNVFVSIGEEFFTFTFTSLTSIYNSLLYITTIIGMFLIIFMKNKPFRYKYLIIILIAFIIARFHYVVTLPLFKIEYFSVLITEWFMIFLHVILFVFCIVEGIESIKNEKVRIKIFVFIILSLCILVCFAKTQSLLSDKFYQYGKTPLPSYIIEASEWVKANTNISDVFISTNEISFMFNSVTGSKFVSSRRSHSGMWVDVDKRWVDEAVILYGNNSIERDRLLKLYNVKYIYWQYNWIDLDYQLDENKQIVNWFDPLLIRDINNYSVYLTENGVKYIKLRTWLDPAVRRNEVKQFDTLMVYPSQWDNLNPWNKDFNDKLIIRKEFYQDGMIAARIYGLQ